MTNPTTVQRQDAEELEQLLPWHAAGTLRRRDAERVDAALKADGELARRYALVREELSETILLNESLGAPSGRAFERLMTAIDAEPTPARSRGLLGLATRIAGRLADVRPRTLAWSTIAATFAIVLQAGLIAGLSVDVGGKKDQIAKLSSEVRETRQTLAQIDTDTRTRSLGPHLASRDKGACGGAFALIAFAPQATSAEMTAFLRAHEASIVEGPSPEGVFRACVSSTALSADELSQLVKRFQEDKIVRYAVPTR